MRAILAVLLVALIPGLAFAAFPGSGRYAGTTIVPSCFIGVPAGTVAFAPAGVKVGAHC